VVILNTVAWVKVAGPCWMLDSGSDLGPENFRETGRDIEQSSEDTCREWII